MYRTKTYIAGDWTGDSDAINKLYEWNEGKHWGLSFHDAHELTQSRDTSLNCSIKISLRKRLAASKCFVLIVGDKTNMLTSGGCQLCNSYNSYTHHCARNHSVDFRSYIQYECDVAFDSNIKIIVLYNSLLVNKNKCPEILRDCPIHIPLIYHKNGCNYWNYNDVKNAFDY